MRQIGSIEGERDAARFGDYLLTLGIGNNVEQGSDGGAWAVWVENDDHLDRGRTELERFRASPGDARYDAAAHASDLRRREEKAEQRRRKQFFDVRARWGQPSQLARPVTILLAAISIVVSIGGTKLGYSEGPPSPVTNALYIAPIELLDNGYVQWDDLHALTHGQVWRAVTPIFLHFSPLHLIFNMIWLLDLGSLIETRRGSLFLLSFVLVTAAVSNVAEYYLPNPYHPNPMFGGMSGIVYALFGYAWMKGKYQPHLGIGVAPQTVTIMLFWLVLCMTPLLGIAVANVAHVTGLLGGVVFAYVPYAFKRMTRGR